MTPPARPDGVAAPDGPIVPASPSVPLSETKAELFKALGHPARSGAGRLLVWHQHGSAARRDRRPGGGPLPAPAQLPKPPLSITPASQPAPAQENSWRDGPHYSAQEIARAVFGHLAGKREYVEHVAEVARGAGYAVIASEAETFSKDQAEWVAAQAMSRPRPVEHILLNGKGRG